MLGIENIKPARILTSSPGGLFRFVEEMMAKLLTTLELADALSLDVRTVRTWANTKRIPAIRLNRFWRFDEQAVLAALKK